MPTKSNIISFIQGLADATEDPQTMIGFGTPGGHTQNIIGEIKPTGAAWDESDGIGPFPLIIDGISKALGLYKKITGSYSQQKDIGIIGVGSIPGSGLTVTILQASQYGTNRMVLIKDESGTSSPSKVITVNVAGGGTIDGLSTISINSMFGRYRLYSNGTGWFTA